MHTWFDEARGDRRSVRCWEIYGEKHVKLKNILQKTEKMHKGVSPIAT